MEMAMDEAAAFMCAGFTGLRVSLEGDGYEIADIQRGRWRHGFQNAEILERHADGFEGLRIEPAVEGHHADLRVVGLVDDPAVEFHGGGDRFHRFRPMVT